MSSIEVSADVLVVIVMIPFGEENALVAEEATLEVAQMGLETEEMK